MRLLLHSNCLSLWAVLSLSGQMFLRNRSRVVRIRRIFGSCDKRGRQSLRHTSQAQTAVFHFDNREFIATEMPAISGFELFLSRLQPILEMILFRGRTAGLAPYLTSRHVPIAMDCNSSCTMTACTAWEELEAFPTGVDVRNEPEVVAGFTHTEPGAIVPIQDATTAPF